MDIAITNIDYLLTGTEVLRNTDVVIRDGMIASVKPSTNDSRYRDATIIDGTDKAVMPSFKNAHTHAAMTLLRGYGDDMPLDPWLRTRIWPAEAVLLPEDIYWGTRLAALEMIRTGTTFANDMYFVPDEAIRAFRDAKIRAAVGLAIFDFNDHERCRREKKTIEELLARYPEMVQTTSPQRVFLAIAPHSPYTCSSDLLSWSAALSESTGLAYHIHMSETRGEVERSRDDHGAPPFTRLESLGVWGKTGNRTIAAHGVWVDDAEINLIGKYGITVAYNPVSNMKLASGALPYKRYRDLGIPLMIGPDGVASNNNLDMIEELKIAALLQKHATGDATALPASEALSIAWGGRSSAFADFGVSGTLVAGDPADIAIIDLRAPQLNPIHDIASNIAYAANGSLVETVICDGEILMRDHKIPGQDEVIDEARRCAAALAKRAANA